MRCGQVVRADLVTRLLEPFCVGGEQSERAERRHARRVEREEPLRHLLDGIGARWRVREQRSEAARLGPFDVALMGPTESISENGGRYIINFPFLEVMVGSEARKGAVGENQRARLVNIDYEGLYQGGSFKESGSDD